MGNSHQEVHLKFKQQAMTATFMMVAYMCIYRLPVGHLKRELAQEFYNE